VKSEGWLQRLLFLWMASFAGLLMFLYMLLIGSEIDGRSVFQMLFR
jgi:hypothetical protein